MMMFKKVTTLLSLSAVLSMPVQAAPMVWDMPNEYPATSVQAEGDRYFGEQLKRESGGQIEIMHHFGGALGLKSKDQLDAVGDGAVVIANTFIPPLGGIDPIFLLSSLPFLSSSSEEARLLFEAARPEYERVLEKHNQRLLYASPWPSSGLWGKQEASTMSAVNGLKMRTYDANGTKVFRNTNSAPIQLSWADIIPQLSTGGIEGVLTSIEAGLSASFNDYVSHFTALNYDSTINLITMNQDAWDELSPEQQQAVVRAAEQTETYVWSHIDQVVNESYADARSRGVTVVETVPAEFRDQLKQAAQPVLEEWVSKMGPKGEQLLSEYRKALQQPALAAN
ncbi:TRAP transporter substrate-binding protein [Oceanimonas sp. CHS3-5]|uniref:TRAP transporter substrate-binding protein n=1 Tax=Oceanimonas sp. CHS3-5 TaxID=3068186 RepID=UPI00273D306C|nr:TRAP transporter substrate-binding protein [Oceanimonas sp. CHS3-5]MDP5291813.1 TRAP transporter substrate-binding protein [Oceanimonas sp. CHS3-5]